MTVLDRYIVRSILGSVFLVMIAVLILGALFVFIDQQDEIGVGHYTAMEAVWFTLLNLPQQAFELLPITVLIGSLLGLGSLARGSELIVIRATGMSIVRLARTVLIAGLLLIGLEVLLGEFLAPPLQVAAREQKAFAKYTDISFGGGGRAWVRDGNLILNVARQSGQTQFSNMQIFELSDDHNLLAIGHATSATAGADKKWQLGGYTESRFADNSVQTLPPGQRTLRSHVTAGFLGLAAQDPEQLTSRSLWQLIQYYRANSLDPSQYLFAFWSRIARTVAIGFSVLLAIPFVLGSLRSSGAGTRTLMGLLLGICFFLLQKLIESGTIVFALNPAVLAWIPTATMGMVTFFLLARAR
jgi:lipopolysaccharide export system permease protein